MSNMDILIAYETLGIEANAPMEVINSAFGDLSKLYHPDNPNGDAEKYVKILRAFKYLVEIKQSSSEIRQIQLDPSEIDLNLTLKEIFTGCEKEVIIVRNNFDKDGINIHQEKVPVKVRVKQGVQTGTQITIKNVGDWQPEKIQANVNFIVRQIEHPIFKRTGQFNLEYKAKITYDEAVFGCQIRVPTLDTDFDHILLDIKRIVDENSERIIKKRGLFFSDGKQRGDLIVKFDISKDIGQLNSGKVKKIELKLTLYEIFKGCTRMVEISRKRIDSDRVEYDDEKAFKIEIKPGTKDGTEILFSKEGDQLDALTFEDIVFVITDIPNETFERKGSDVIYCAKISEKQLKAQDEIEIPTLEGETKRIQLDENIAQNMEKRIYGKGLPYPGDTKSRGSLFVKFEIVSDDEIFRLKSKDNKRENLIEKKSDKGPNDANLPRLENQLPSNHYYLTLTLEEIYFGCKKFPKIKRKINKGNVEHTSEVPLELWVKPGSIKGTQIVQYQEGDRQFCMIPADVVFTVAVEEHSIFKVEDFNLVYFANITYRESKFGCDLEIPTIDHDLIPISVKGPIAPQTEKHIPGFGFPILDSKNGKHGDIIVRFNIISSKQNPTQKYDIQLSLEEILSGVTKKMKIQKQVIDSNGIQNSVEKILSVNVKPGTEAGTEFKFPREGDQNHGCIPADIIFTARVKPHAVFTRNKADIHYKLKLYKSELNVGKEFAIPTLDSNETIPLYVNESINATTQKRIPNCGLPFQRNSNLRGDIVVGFQILPDTKDPDIIHEIFLTLENFINGFKKVIDIKRKKLCPNGEEQYENKTIEIDIRPGILPGKSYKFKNLGDEAFGIIPADILFVVRDKPHPIFKRNGTDIEYTTYVTKEESKYRLKLEIPTLDVNETNPLIWEISMYYSYFFSKTFHGKGLFGKYGNPTMRGDLIARYEIVNDDQKVPTIEEKVLISLEDVLYGCNKSVKYSRLIVGLEGSKIHEEMNVSLDIKAGFEAGEDILYYRHGNIVPGHSPGDVRFVFIDEPHDVFQRFGPDLLYIAKYTLSEAAKLKSIKVPTLENEPQFLTIEEITKDSVMEIPNKGLPYFENSRKRGKIIVNFDIIDDEPKNSKNSSTSDQNNKIAVEINLSEVLSGCDKCLTFERKTVDQAGNISYKNIAFLWSIKPGTKEGVEFAIKKRGHRYYGKKQEDVIYVLKYLENENFKRIGSNLEYTANITYEQSIRGKLKLQIPTLVYNKSYPLTVIKPIEENYVHIVKGHGLPLHENSKKCGDIIVKFKIGDKNTTDNNTNEQYSNQLNEIKLEISLEEILYGNKRTEHLYLSSIRPDGKVIKINKSFLIKIEPGMRAGEKFVFPKQGNESFRGIEDVVYVIQDKPHQTFKRNGADIEYISKLNSSQISQGAHVQIPTLENSIAILKITKQVKNGEIFRLKNKGLPYHDNFTKRGDILVQFDVLDDVRT